MPRIEDKILNCSIYLYKDVQAAEIGEDSGGSGFIVAVSSKVLPSSFYPYAVTNSHVIREGNSPIVRLTSQAGDTLIVELESSDWVHHPDGDDVAICHLKIPKEFQINAVSSDMLVDSDIIEKESLGPGDEVFMIGRFIGYDGKQKNKPSVRFGNLSMMHEFIYHPTREINQESFIVETRSLSGYSGSPVFVYTAPFYPRPGQQRRGARLMLYLLGIDWCHIPDYKRILDSEKKDPIDEKWFVEANTGMAGVVPAWKIKELLEAEELRQVREASEKRLEKEKPSGVVQDTIDKQDVTEQ